MGDGMTCPYPSPLQESSTLSNTEESALNENLPSPWSDGGAILESTDFPPVPPTIGSSGKNIIREKHTKGIADSRNSKRSGGKSDKSESSVRCDLCGWNFDNEKFLQLHKVTWRKIISDQMTFGPSIGNYTLVDWRSRVKSSLSTTDFFVRFKKNQVLPQLETTDPFWAKN